MGQMAWILILIFGILIIYISKTNITIYDKKNNIYVKAIRPRVQNQSTRI